MDWDKLKREYITTSISYRSLAAKYKVPLSNLNRIASRDKWYEQRVQYRHRVDTKSLAKSESQATNYKSFLYDLAYKVASQLNDMTNNMTVAELAAAGIKPRDITGAIKDLEDALHVKSAADIRKQEARIANLRKQAEGDNADNEIKITIGDNADAYSK